MSFQKYKEFWLWEYLQALQLKILKFNKGLKQMGDYLKNWNLVTKNDEFLSIIVVCMVFIFALDMTTLASR